MIKTITERVEIAKTIIDQMGGYTRLRLMISIGKIKATDSGVDFSFRGCKSVNKCIIELNTMDLYDMKLYNVPTLRTDATPAQVNTFFEKQKKSKTPVFESDGLYHDMLIDIFKSHTGLELRL